MSGILIMAYHDDKPGHTRIILGRYYSRFNHYTYDAVKLIKHNPITGLCGLRVSSGIYWVSETDLSKWYLLPESFYEKED